MSSIHATPCPGILIMRLVLKDFRVPHGATMLDEEVVLVDVFTPRREEFLK